VNVPAVQAIYAQEMGRFFRTVTQSLVAPVLSTSLYFVVFGAAIGGRIQEVEGVSYGAFIVPGLIMLSVITQGISNASFGIYFPKFIGTIFEILSAPVSFFEACWAMWRRGDQSLHHRPHHPRDEWFFVDISLAAIPLADAGLPCASPAVEPSRCWASSSASGPANFEQLQLHPALHRGHAARVSGGSFYSISMLPALWQTVALFNPVVYLDLGLPLVLLRHRGRAGGRVAPRHRGLHGRFASGSRGWIFRTGWRLRR
jgi:ABC-2 type transport system permease protein